MKPVSIIILLLFTGTHVWAQLSRVDSSFVIQFGAAVRVSNDLSDSSLHSNEFFLVKFQRSIPSNRKQSYHIVRELSDQHAIVMLTAQQRKNVLLRDVEFITPANNLWKMPPGIQENTNYDKIEKWFLTSLDKKKFLEIVGQLNSKIIREDSASNSFLLQLREAKDIRLFISSPAVKFLQPYTSTPREELLVNGFDLSANRVNLVHFLHPNVNGTGVVVSVNENRFDSSDIDFKGRYVPTGVSSSVITGHATIMATMIGGGGNSYYLGKGVAWNTKLASVDFSSLLPQPNSFYQQFRVSVENHSYGTSIENFYGADAVAYDASVVSNPTLVHVFSSGNSGNSSSLTGKYVGIENFANLTGSFKMAKNIITVGATDSFNKVEVLSSRGPAFDGRINPDIVAFGQDGSSGAAAIVSGTALLMQQAYKFEHQDSLPPASLIKAALITSADEIGSNGPDYISGFGALNANHAIEAISNGHYFLNTVADKNSQSSFLSIPSNIQRLKVTLAYSDVPAQPNTFKALINDLDLDVKDNSSAQIWKPWVLSTAASKDSLMLPARRDKDTLNNIEQVTIDFPSAGLYEIKVSGSHVSTSSQEYSLAYQLDTMNKFEWDFPRRNDAVPAATQPALRWHESFGGDGILEYSLDKGTTWQLTSSNVNLSQAYFKWTTPDTFATVLLRMTINGQRFVSDSFLISKNIQLHVGLNCEDSVMLSWNAVSPADHYQLYALTTNFLQPIVALADTTIIFAKKDINSKYFTVAPVIENREGIKGFTINYETQGVGCYFKNFLAALEFDKALISFELGTLYQINRIDIEKDSGNTFTRVQTFHAPLQQSNQSQIGNLHQGINRFRIKIILQNGTNIYSEEEIVYYTAKNNFVVYPNPVKVGQPLIVLRNNLDDAALVLYDAYGRKMQELPLQDIVNPINTSFLQRGIYVMVIFENQKRVFQQKVILQ